MRPSNIDETMRPGETPHGHAERLAREKATAQRVLRSADDPNHVFIVLEFASLDDANESRRRLLDSGVLDRFEDKDGPTVLQEAD